MVSAILNVHKSAETERTALAHGHFGITDTIPDGLLWMNTTDYVAIRTIFTLVGDKNVDDAVLNKIADILCVYKARELITIREDFKRLAWLWHDLVVYLQTDANDPKCAELYRQLCDRPRVAQELATLRQKNNPSTQPQSPQPTEVGTA